MKPNFILRCQTLRICILLVIVAFTCSLTAKAQNNSTSGSPDTKIVQPGVEPIIISTGESVNPGESSGTGIQSLNGDAGHKSVSKKRGGSSTAVAPSLSETHFNLPCHGDSIGSINLSVNGGTPPVTFLWSNGATTEDISGLFAGTYTVTVTDGAQATASLSVTITAPPQLTVTVNAPQITCNNFVSTLTTTVAGGTPPYSYSWNTGATTQGISVANPGVFTVLITDANSCLAVGSATVNINSCAPVVACSPSGVITCANPTRQITATASPCPNNSIMSYFWSTGATTQSITVSNGNAFTVTVTQTNGCTSSSSCSVGVNVCVPSVAVSVNGTITCLNPTRTIVGTASPCPGNTISSFLWNNGSATSAINVSIPGSYCVTVTQSNGCTSSVCTTVLEDVCEPVVTCTASAINNCNNPVATISSTASACPNNGIISYLWSNGAVTQNIQVFSTATFTVTVTQSNGCTATTSCSGVVTNTSCPVVCSQHIVISCSNPTDSICIPQPTATCSYSLRDPNGILILNLGCYTLNEASLPGIYTVTSTDSSNGCTSTCTTLVTKDFSQTTPVSDIILTCDSPSYLFAPPAGNGDVYELRTGGQNFVEVNFPVFISGSYFSAPANFGPMALTPLTGQLVLVNDGIPNSLNACEPLLNGLALAGKIAVIERGDCFFVDKILQAQAAGAIAVLMLMITPDPIFSMGNNGFGDLVTIPAVMISQADGSLIKAQLLSNVPVSLSIMPQTFFTQFTVPHLFTAADPQGAYDFITYHLDSCIDNRTFFFGGNFAALPPDVHQVFLNCNQPFDEFPASSDPDFALELRTGGQTNMTINGPGNIAGIYATVPPAFGPVVLSPLTGDLVFIDDGVFPNTNACEPIINAVDLAGKIVVIDRGNCFFVDKILQAQGAGALAVIMVMSTPDPPSIMGDNGFGGFVTIPSVMISQADGNLIRTELNNSINVNVTLNPTTGYDVVPLPHTFTPSDPFGVYWEVLTYIPTGCSDSRSFALTWNFTVCDFVCPPAIEINCLHPTAQICLPDNPDCSYSFTVFGFPIPINPGCTTIDSSATSGVYTISSINASSGCNFTCEFDITVDNDPSHFQIISCDSASPEIVVNQNVTVDFNYNPPHYTGDPDLLPYVSYDRSAATPDDWKVIFNVGNRALHITSGATITTTRVNGYAPGISIFGECNMLIDFNGHIVVNSLNKNAGDIVIQMNGYIYNVGEIRDEMSGTTGLPGSITLISVGSTINIGRTGQVYVLGTDDGGNTITLYTCGQNCGEESSISVAGLVKSYAHAHGGNQALNRPNINVVSINDAVAIYANTVEPLYDEFSNSGSLYDIYPGLLSWVRDNVAPGTIRVQGKTTVSVRGHGTDPTGPVRKSFGGVAAIGTASNAPGGIVDVRSLEGDVVGYDRAFDVSGRNRNAVNYAHNYLYAHNDIRLLRTGSNNNFNPVVNASSPNIGDKGGINELYAFNGSIIVDTNAIVSAAVPFGAGSVQGTNILTACNGVFSAGTITPADLNPFDDIGSCNPSAPFAIFEGCISSVGNGGPRLAGITDEQGSGSVLFQNYPNPFSNITTIGYRLENSGNVKLTVVDMLGSVVAILLDANQNSGEHQLDWNAEGFASGTYYVRLESGDFASIKKLILMK